LALVRNHPVLSSVGADLCVCPGRMCTQRPGQTHRSAPTLRCRKISVLAFGSIISLTSIIYVLFGLLTVLAQSGPIEVRVARLSGRASLTRGTARPFPLRRGDVLAPGDVIETGPTARVSLELSDGSQMAIYGSTRVVLQDFRQAGSLRELVNVVLGRVRFKINKLGGRPNPYRVNSPTASIAVRGTEFTVSVAASGETRVAVFEGLVEVTSRLDPQQRRLVEPGRSVIVRPSGDISLRLPGPGSELEAQIKPLSNQLSSYFRASADAVALGFDSYNRAVTESSVNNLPARFAAFADGHFDSLFNPAYATEFKRGDGRLYFLPSLSAPFEHGRPATGAPSVHPFDYAVAAQASYFAPLDSRWVIGGGLATTRTRLESFAFYQTREEQSRLTRTHTLEGSLAADTGTASLLVARSFGAGARTSLGLKLERTESRAVLNTTEVNKEEWQGTPEPFVSQFFNDRHARSHRTTAMLGFAHDFERGDKLGLSYSYGAAASGFRYRLDDVQATFGNPVIAQGVATRMMETAVLLRGPVTRRLFYGVEGAWLSERVTDDRQHKKSTLVERRETQRPRIGGGFGFALRPRTVFSVDLSFAHRRVTADTVELSRDESLRNKQHYSTSFVNGHLGLQSDLGRRLIASASVLRVFERRAFERLDYRERQYYTFSHFGLGWRVRPAWLVEYFIATDYGRRGPSHTVVLRYDFSFSRGGN
jgi:hypothetical protein